MPKEINLAKQQELKYEFVCLYKDGTQVHQKFNTQDELQFNDIDQENLEVFGLTDGNKHFSVNLKTGEFNINNTIINFDLCVIAEKDGNTYKVNPTNYRLIYFRRIKKDFTPTGIITSIRFAFGWQTEVNGENHQRIALIEPNDTVTFINRK